jgi:hypothetical protein
MASDYKYKAFISYNHKDTEWADWLFKALDRYSVPKRLRGTVGRDGPVIDRLYPVFRDRDEMPSSADLNSQVQVALEQSAYLVVICSPNAAASRWVNEEILAFKRMGRAGRIFGVIIDGTPNAGDEPSLEELERRASESPRRTYPPSVECFPRALKYTLSGERVEPFAPDVRKEADGLEGTRLKTIAALLGVDFETLKRRDLEARRASLRRRIAIALAVIVALVGTLAAAWMLSLSNNDIQKYRFTAFYEPYEAAIRSRFPPCKYDAGESYTECSPAYKIAFQGDLNSDGIVDFVVAAKDNCSHHTGACFDDVFVGRIDGSFYRVDIVSIETTSNSVSVQASHTKWLDLVMQVSNVDAYEANRSTYPYYEVLSYNGTEYATSRLLFCGLSILEECGTPVVFCPLDTDYPSNRSFSDYYKTEGAPFPEYSAPFGETNSLIGGQNERPSKAGDDAIIRSAYISRDRKWIMLVYWGSASRFALAADWNKYMKDGLPRVSDPGCVATQTNVR